MRQRLNKTLSLVLGNKIQLTLLKILAVTLIYKSKFNSSNNNCHLLTITKLTSFGITVIMSIEKKSKLKSRGGRHNCKRRKILLGLHSLN